MNVHDSKKHSKRVEKRLDWLREKFAGALEEKVLLTSGLVVMGINQAGSSVCARVFNVLQNEFNEYLRQMANNERIMFYIFVTSGIIDNADEAHVKHSI